MSGSFSPGLQTSAFGFRGLEGFGDPESEIRGCDENNFCSPVLVAAVWACRRFFFCQEDVLGFV